MSGRAAEADASRAGLVSVCVATFNGEAFVAEQLRSILASRRVDRGHRLRRRLDRRHPRRRARAR